MGRKGQSGIWKEQAIWKLIADTMAMREKMEKMQLTFRKAQGMDDYL